MLISLEIYEEPLFSYFYDILNNDSFKNDTDYNICKGILSTSRPWDESSNNEGLKLNKPGLFDRAKRILRSFLINYKKYVLYYKKKVTTL